jgi:dihydrofolate reductase
MRPVTTKQNTERSAMMRKVIVWNMVTLDGYFEGPKPWEIDWHEYVWGEEMERFSLDQAQEVGALLFGRMTYEGMAGYWSTATGEVAECSCATHARDESNGTTSGGNIHAI